MFVVASKTSSSCLYYVVCACVDLIFPSMMMMNIELPLVEMSTYVSDYCHKVGIEISRSVIDVNEKSQTNSSFLAAEKCQHMFPTINFHKVGY